MIISRKRFNEKVSEELEKRERERWLCERIERAERECNERIDGVMKYVCDLEAKIALLEGDCCSHGKRKVD